MKLADLMKDISQYISVLKPFTDEYIDITSLNIYKNNQTEFTTGCLYLGNISDITVDLNNINFLGIFIQNEVNIDLERYNLNSNICIIKSKKEKYDLFSELLNIMNQEIHLSLCSQRFFDVVSENKGIQYLIDIAREEFGYPMIIRDSTFKVLASSYDVSDILQLTEDSNGDKYLDEETINYIKYQNIHKKIHYNKSIKEENKPDNWLGTLISSVCVEEIEIAHIAICEWKIPFNEFHFKLLESLNKALSLELQKNNLFNIDKKLIPNYILSDLLEKKYLDDDTISRRFHYLNWTKSNSLNIMVIVNKDNNYFDSKVPFIMQSLSAFIPSNNCVVYKSALVVFINDSLIHNLIEHENKEFINYLKLNSLYAGISPRFSKLSDSWKYYIQAKKASEIAQKYNINFSPFGKSIPYILYELLSANYDLYDLNHPAVTKLIEEDKKNGSNLLETLKQYIYFNNSPSKAAEVLNIHRNTLFYRINKIKEITGITLDYADEILQIYISIKMIEINSRNKTCFNTYTDM